VGSGERHRSHRACKSCGSQRVRPSRPRGALESRLRSITSTRYYQCRDCGGRARLPRGRSDPPKSAPGPLFWVAVGLLGAAVAFLIRRAG
jgi:hypothetical protein